MQTPPLPYRRQGSRTPRSSFSSAHSGGGIGGTLSQGGLLEDALANVLPPPGQHGPLTLYQAWALLDAQLAEERAIHTSTLMLLRKQQEAELSQLGAEVQELRLQLTATQEELQEREEEMQALQQQVQEQQETISTLQATVEQQQQEHAGQQQGAQLANAAAESAQQEERGVQAGTGDATLVDTGVQAGTGPIPSHSDTAVGRSETAADKGEQGQQPGSQHPSAAALEQPGSHELGVSTPPQREHPSLPTHSSGSHPHLVHQLSEALATVARLRVKATQQAAAAEALQSTSIGAGPVVMLPPPPALLPSSPGAPEQGFQQEEDQEGPTAEQQAAVGAGIDDQDVGAALQQGNSPGLTPTKQQQQQAPHQQQQQQQEVKRAWDLSKAWVAAENSHRANIARLHEEEMSRKEQLHRLKVARLEYQLQDQAARTQELQALVASLQEDVVSSEQALVLVSE